MNTKRCSSLYIRRSFLPKQEKLWKVIYGYIYNHFLSCKTRLTSLVAGWNINADCNERKHCAGPLGVSSLEIIRKSLGLAVNTG